MAVPLYQRHCGNAGSRVTGHRPEERALRQGTPRVLFLRGRCPLARLAGALLGVGARGTSMAVGVDFDVAVSDVVVWTRR